MDRCQSQDGAQAALQELERYVDTAPLHTLADRSALCCQYEAVLSPQLKVGEVTRTALSGGVSLMWYVLPQDQVDKVFQKQSSVQEMFEKRRVSLKKLATKQTRPVQPVSPRPEAKSPQTSPSQWPSGSSAPPGSGRGPDPLLLLFFRSAEEREEILCRQRHVQEGSCVRTCARFGPCWRCAFI